MRHPRHRRCLVLRGGAVETLGAALWLTHKLCEDDVLWVGDEGSCDLAAGRASVDENQDEISKSTLKWTAPRAVRRLLGVSYDAVVLDLHQGLDADVLAQCHGFIRGGGALLLRVPGDAAEPSSGRSRLALYPHTLEEVTEHCWRRLVSHLRADSRVERGCAEVWRRAEPLEPAPRALSGTLEQAALVSRLAALLHEATPQAVVLTADRGRGKSSALGLALRRWGASETAQSVHSSEPTNALTSDQPINTRSSRAPIVLTAADERALTEVRRFAAGDPLKEGKGEGRNGPDLEVYEALATPPALRYVSPAELVRAPCDARIIVIDEAAQLPVPLLQRITRRHPAAHLIFATTTHGYEGTGRGFSLRFRTWLAEQRRPLTDLTLHSPIRWEEGDPLEAMIFKALALDAEPEQLAVRSSPPRPSHQVSSKPAAQAFEHVVEDRAALAMDDERLSAIFGLLVQAHYRTTPADLQRMLDAPNLALHTLAHEGAVVAVNLVAREGGLPASLSARMLSGKERVRGHALPDTLICHAGCAEAGALDMIRSVRIATHPQLRRRGLARILTGHMHDAHSPELFGTLFAAEEGVLQFRRSLGYRLVRVGTSLSARTGTPSLVMVRPRTERARELTSRLRAAMARDLPWQLRLMAQGDAHAMAPALRAAIEADLPRPASLTLEEALEAAHQVAFGARHFEAAAWPIRCLLTQHQECLSALPEPASLILSARAVEGLSWARVTRLAGLGSPRVAMRAMRRALQELLRSLEGRPPQGD